MKSSIFVFLLTLTVFLGVSGDDLDNYSIDAFLNYMQEVGYYDVIVQIKYVLGEDIAIEFCKNLVQSNHCEQLVKIYIPPKQSRAPRRYDPEVIGEEPEEPQKMEVKEILVSIVLTPEFIEIFERQGLSISDIEEIIDKTIFKLEKKLILIEDVPFERIDVKPIIQLLY